MAGRGGRGRGRAAAAFLRGDRPADGRGGWPVGGSAVHLASGPASGPVRAWAWDQSGAWVHPGAGRDRVGPGRRRRDARARAPSPANREGRDGAAGGPSRRRLERALLIRVSGDSYGRGAVRSFRRRESSSESRAVGFGLVVLAFKWRSCLAGVERPAPVRLRPPPLGPRRSCLAGAAVRRFCSRQPQRGRARPGPGRPAGLRTPES